MEVGRNGCKSQKKLAASKQEMMAGELENCDEIQALLYQATRQGCITSYMWEMRKKQVS